MRYGKSETGDKDDRQETRQEKQVMGDVRHEMRVGRPDMGDWKTRGGRPGYGRPKPLKWIPNIQYVLHHPTLRYLFSSFLPNLLLQEYWIQPCFKCYFFSWFSLTKHNLDLNSPHCPHCASHPTFQEYMLTLKNNFTILSFTSLFASLMSREGVYYCCGF